MKANKHSYGHCLSKEFKKPFTASKRVEGPKRRQKVRNKGKNRNISKVTSKNSNNNDAFLNRPLSYKQRKGQIVIVRLALKQR